MLRELDSYKSTIELLMDRDAMDQLRESEEQRKKGETAPVEKLLDRL